MDKDRQILDKKCDGIDTFWMVVCFDISSSDDRRCSSKMKYKMEYQPSIYFIFFYIISARLSERFVFSRSSKTNIKEHTILSISFVKELYSFFFLIALVYIARLTH